MVGLGVWRDRERLERRPAADRRRRHRLYLKALLGGLAEVPPVPAEIRAQAEALSAKVGDEASSRELARLDRKERAACRPPIGSAWSRLGGGADRTAPAGGSARRAAAPAVVGRFATIALMPARPQLYATLDARFDRMLAEGAIDEVSALLILGLDADLPAMKAVGISELAGYLRRETSWTRLRRKRSKRHAGSPSGSAPGWNRLPGTCHEGAILGKDPAGTRCVYSPSNFDQ